MSAASINTLLESAEKGVTDYLTRALQAGRIDEQSYDLAARNTFSSLKNWLEESGFAADLAQAGRGSGRDDPAGTLGGSRQRLPAAGPFRHRRNPRHDGL